jgi:hypothetical protein
VFELLRGEMVSLLNGSSVKTALVKVVSVKVMLLEGVSIGGGSTQRGVRASAGTGKVRFGEPWARHRELAPVAARRRSPDAPRDDFSTDQTV